MSNFARPNGYMHGETFSSLRGTRSVNVALALSFFCASRGAQDGAGYVVFRVLAPFCVSH